MCGVLSHTYVDQDALYLIPVRGWLGLRRYPMALVRLLMPVGTSRDFYGSLGVRSR